jgi:hypothetical protein
VGGFFGVDFADDLDTRHNVEVNAAFFEGAALPEALFCEGFNLAGYEALSAGDEDADVVAGMDGEVFCFSDADDALARVERVVGWKFGK